MKKLVLTLMSLMLIFAFASCGKKGITYSVSDDGTYAVVTGYTGKATEIVISDTYKGLPVRRIANGAFFVQSELTSVTIPDSVTSIGSFAFAHCSGLTSVTIPDSVTTIEAGVFANCLSLTQINVDEKNQYYKSIDGNLYSKDGTRFIHYATGKTENSFVILDSVVTIDLCAFAGCSNLTSVTIPNSVTTICDGAFNGCTQLASVTIPDSVTTIGDKALADSNVFIFSETDIIIEAIEVVLGRMYNGTFSNCSGLTSVTIPDSVTMIGPSTFKGCSGLTNVTIPNSVTSIGSCAFSGCSGLTSVVIPDSITKIGDWAFSGCSGLTSVVIPDSITKIGDCTFIGCSGLTSVVIPDSVTEIGNSAFYDCTVLTSVYYEGTAEDWANITSGSLNPELTNATRYYYSETQPTESGNYWHYDENGDIVVW